MPLYPHTNERLLPLKKALSHLNELISPGYTARLIIAFVPDENLDELSAHLTHLLRDTKMLYHKRMRGK
jgi:hypothetical protein